MGPLSVAWLDDANSTLFLSTPLWARLSSPYGYDNSTNCIENSFQDVGQDDTPMNYYTRQNGDFRRIPPLIGMKESLKKR